MVADTADELDAKPEQIAAHKRLVEQAVKLFGAQHYDHYDFLLTISDNLGGIGLEHHRSSEDGVDPGYFTDWDRSSARPQRAAARILRTAGTASIAAAADLWTPDYRTPMQDSLLWVYEGQTQFWGYVLGARSGMLSKEDTLGAIASIAATYGYATPGPQLAAAGRYDQRSDHRAARAAAVAQLAAQRGLLQRRPADLDRRRPDHPPAVARHDARSTISPAPSSACNDRDYGELTYTFDDVVATLNAVQPYDWAGYLNRRVLDVAANRAARGHHQGRLQPRLPRRADDLVQDPARRSARMIDLTYSGGFVVGKDGKITSVLWDSAAFNAGLTVGSELLAVNGRKFDGDGLKAAIKDGEGPKRADRACW